MLVHGFSESVAEGLYFDNDTILEADTLHKPTRPEVVRPDLAETFLTGSHADGRKHAERGGCGGYVEASYMRPSRQSLPTNEKRAVEVVIG